MNSFRGRDKVMRKRDLSELLILLLCLGPFLQATPAKAVLETTIQPALEDGHIYNSFGGYGDYSYTAWLKFNISTLLDKTIVSATLKLYMYDYQIGFDGDARIWRVNNQTWSDSNNDGNDIFAMSTDTQADVSAIDPNDIPDWGSFDITDIVQADVSGGHTNCSIKIDDPDDTQDSLEAGVPFYGSATYLIYGRAESGYQFDGTGYSSDYGTAASRPKLVVTYAEPAYFTIAYDFPTATDQSVALSPYEFKNGTSTQRLYRINLYPYQNQTDITISGIPTTYAFAYINPNVSTYTDTISTDGTIVFENLWNVPYEVIFDPNERWHLLHIMMHNPDLVGLGWESFTIWINSTRVPYPPAYKIQQGYYEYSVKDYFAQTILTGNFTIETSDAEDVYLDLEVPLYEVAFQNGDLAPYRVEITRNGITRDRTAPPKGAVKAYLYGLASNVPYTVEIYNENSEQLIDWYTLNVPNYPFSKPLEYDDDEHRVSYPSYQDQFNSVKTTVVNAVAGQNLLLLLGFAGILLTIVVNRLGLLATIFRKPLFSDRRDRR